jgi:hypothetical protein
MNREEDETFKTRRARTRELTADDHAIRDEDMLDSLRRTASAATRDTTSSSEGIRSIISMLISSGTPMEFRLASRPSAPATAAASETSSAPSSAE